MEMQTESAYSSYVIYKIISSVLMYDIYIDSSMTKINTWVNSFIWY
jgi:hypothetical protein